MAQRKLNDGGKKRETPAKPRKAKRGTAAQNSTPRQGKKSAGELLDYGLMKALSHEDRVRAFAILAERVASPNELAKELNEGLSQVSYHVKVLEGYELIELVRTEPRRGAVEHYYRAVEQTLIPPGAWDNLPPAVRKSVSVSILSEFFDDASASMEAGVFDKSPGELSWSPLILDALGVKEFGQLARDFLESVMKLQANANKRLLTVNGKAAEATSATVFLASSYRPEAPRAA